MADLTSKLFKDGEILLADDLNEILLAVFRNPEWTTLPKPAGWDGVVRHAKIGAKIRVEVSLTGVNGTTMAASTQINLGTLPAGMRPTYPLGTGINMNSFSALLYVDAAGQIRVYNYTGGARGNMQGYLEFYTA